MKTLKEKVYDKCMSIKRKNKTKGKVNVKESYLTNGHFQMNTNILNYDTNMTYDPRYLKQKGEEKLLQTFHSGQEHEDGHHIDCPQTVDKDTDLFFEPMYEILSKNGFNEQDIKYATNALQDTILHDKGKYERDANWDGIINFLEDQGENAENQKLTEFYEAHVKMNMDLWGEKPQRKVLSKFYTNEAKVKEALDEFYSELNEGKFKTSKQTYTKSKKDKNNNWIDRENITHETFDKQAIQKYFLDENNWKEISTAYAKHIQKLMTPGYAMPTPDHSGAGTKGRESEPSENEGNPIQKEREGREFRKERIMEANKKGKKAPIWMKKMEALDLLYESMAEQIQIKAESYTNPESFPITWYGEREFDEERDSFRNISFGFSENGETELRKKQYSIDIPIEVKTSPKSFPKVKFGMIDVSTSMLSGITENSGNEKIIPWGDNSKYHWALMTQFGVFEYFKRNHLLSQNSISAATFAEETKVVEGYQKVKEHLLSPNFVSNTQMNMKEVSKFFEGYGNLIYTCSDGKVWNWNDWIIEPKTSDEKIKVEAILGLSLDDGEYLLADDYNRKITVKSGKVFSNNYINEDVSFESGEYVKLESKGRRFSEDFISEAKRHAYIHFQFGEETEMTKDLKENGLEVIIAKDGKGVVEDVIDLTDKMIRE